MIKRTSARHVASLILVLAMSMRPLAAWADSKSDAQALLDKGNDQVLHGDYLHALESFQSAYSIFPSPKILLNMGTTFRQLGRNAEALDAYEKYVAASDVDESKKAEVQAIEQALSTKVGVLHVEVADARPANAAPIARILIDAKPAGNGATAFDLRVDEGAHSVVVEIGSGEDLKTVAKDTNVSGGKTATVHFDLRPDPVAKTQIIRVNDTYAGDEERRRGRTTRRIAGIASVSVGLAGVAVAAVTGGLVLHDKSVVERQCPASLNGRCKTQSGLDSAKQGRVLLPVNAVGWALGVAGLGVGIPLIVSGIEPASPKATASLTVGPGSLGFEGSF